MPTVQLKHSFGEPTLMGPGGAPKGHPTSTEIHHCMVSIDSSRCVLSIYNIGLENRPSWGPREPPKGTPNGTPPDFHRTTPLYGIDRFVSMHTLTLQHSSGPPGAPQIGHRRSGPIAHPCLLQTENPNFSIALALIHLRYVYCANMMADQS